MKLLALALLLAAAPAARADDAHGHDHPDMAIRIDQALLETPAVVEAERKAVGDKIKDFSLHIKEDGLHVSGGYRVPIISSIRFDATVNLVWTAPNAFELRVHKIKILVFDVTKTVVDVVQKGLGKSLSGFAVFEYAGEREGGVQVLRARVDMSRLMPAVAGLSLSGITTRENVLILKAKLP